MSTQFLGEVKMIGFGFAPKGWALCNGQLLPINQNQALFALLGTSYGGNGVTNFALPDLRARAPVHVGTNNGSGSTFVLGQQGGEAAHTLISPELPTHTHTSATRNFATSSDPEGMLPAAKAGRFGVNAYAPAQHLTPLALGTSNTGGNQAHPNMQPYLTLNFVIALVGIFPSQN